MPNTSRSPEELPIPHAAFAVIRLALQAHLRTLPRRKGERFIKELAILISKEETVRVLLPTRPVSQRAAQSRAQDEAAAWLRQVLPELVRALPD